MHREHVLHVDHRAAATLELVLRVPFRSILVAYAKRSAEGTDASWCRGNLFWAIASSCLLTTIDDLKLQTVIMHQRRQAVSREQVNVTRFLRNVPAVQAKTLKVNCTPADDR